MFVADHSKQEEMGVIARQSIKGALANYLGVAIGFVTTFFVLTRCLTEEEVGLTRVMVDAAMLFSCLAQLGTNASVVKYFPHFKDGKNNHGIFGLSLAIPLVGFLLFGILFLLFRTELVAAYIERSPLVAQYFHLLPMLTFFALYMTVFETNASVLMRVAVPKMVREVGVRLFTLAAYVLYGMRLVSLDVFVWLFCGAYGVAMLLGVIYLLKITHFDWSMFRIDWSFLDRRHRREMLRYTLFMSATVLAGNIPLVNSLFVGAKAGAALTGVYAIAAYIANVVEVPYRSLGAISRPVVASAVKEENWTEAGRLMQQVSLHQLLVSLTIFYLIWINLPTLYGLIPNGDSYVRGTGVVLLLGLAKVTNSSLSIATDLLNYSRHYPWSLVFIAILTASVVLMNSWFISLWGIDGSAAATLLGYVVYFAGLLSFVWCRMRVSLFSVGQAKVLALMAVAFVLNHLWTMWINPVLTSSGSILALLLDAVAKTLVLGTLLVMGVVAWQVSPTVNGLIKQYSGKIISKR